MALKPCPQCGKMISDKAERCPKCGLDLRNTSEQAKAPDAQNISQQPLIEKPTANEGSAYRSNPTIIERHYKSGQPARIDKPKKSRIGLWICVCIILVVGIGAAIWIPVHFHNEKLKAEHLALLEQQRMDSIAAVEAELARLEQHRKDSIKINFRSPDLSFFELHGPIKSVEGDINEIGSHPNDEKKKIDFDINGKLQIASSGSFNSKNCGKIGWKISRDKEGRIINISYNSYDGLSCYPDSKKFKWEDNKIVKKDIYALYGNTHIKYEYNSEGVLEKEVWDLREEEKFEDSPDFETWKITDYEFDKYGNWISRKVNNRTQTRQITYYED